MKQLLIASSNQGKIEEIRSLLEGVDVELIVPEQLNLSCNIEETSKTYRGNARLKAVEYSRISGLVSLGDDSGLEVDVLDGAPGVRSARYTEQIDATDADRRSFLLQQLRNYDRPWHARFVCVVAIASPDGYVQFSEGSCTGEIIPQERGSSGFGYDPIFLVSDLGGTMAELSMKEKNTISHRAVAVKSAIPLINKLIRAGN